MYGETSGVTRQPRMGQPEISQLGYRIAARVAWSLDKLRQISTVEVRFSITFYNDIVLLEDWNYVRLISNIITHTNNYNTKMYLNLDEY